MFDDKPRYGRKPIDACITVVSSVIYLLRIRFPELDKTSNDELLKFFFFELCENRDINGVNTEDCYLKAAEDELDCTLLEYYIMECLPACAYAVDGVFAYRDGHKEKAWQLIAEAQHWVGVLYGKASANHITESYKKSIQEKAANNRHAENRAIKDSIFKFLDENLHKYKNQSKAAEDISEKKKIDYRRVLTYITEYKKKNTAS